MGKVVFRGLAYYVLCHPCGSLSDGNRFTMRFGCPWTRAYFIYKCQAFLLLESNAEITEHESDHAPVTSKLVVSTSCLSPNCGTATCLETSFRIIRMISSVNFVLSSLFCFLSEDRSLDG